MDLARLLKSVGQRTFVTYYREFGDSTLGNSDVADILLKREGFTEKACRSKTTHARDIFGQGLEVAALKAIAASTRADNQVTANAARELLHRQGIGA